MESSGVWEVGPAGVDGIGGLEDVYGAARVSARADGCANVWRERLVRSAVEQARSAGVVFVCAPAGFGKTTLLVQCAAQVRKDPERGMAVLIGAGKLTADELVARLDALGRELDTELTPCIVIDDAPVLTPEQAGPLATCLRDLRAKGFSAIISCVPAARALVETMGDSVKLGAASLKVQPREYARWARAYSIAPSIDVYGMTQGIPVMVAAMAGATRDDRGTEVVRERAVALYRSILAETEASAPAVNRLLSMVLLLGSGNLGDLARCGVRVKNDLLARTLRDYPVFSVDLETRDFSCLGEGRLSCLVDDIAERRPELPMKAARIEMRAWRVDRALELMRTTLGLEECLAVIGMFPAHFALAGRGNYVRQVLASIDASRALTAEVGVVAALFMASLCAGEYGTARTAAQDLFRRAREVEKAIDPVDWACVEGMARAWGTCSGIGLPRFARIAPEGDGRAALLDRHASAYESLVSGDGAFERAVGRRDEGPWFRLGAQLDVPLMLTRLDEALDAALHGGAAWRREEDEDMRALATELEERRQTALSLRVRMVAALRRVMAGMPISDERAFNEAGTMAVREYDLATQLLCLLGEGWQYLLTSQPANALFRAQQVLRLAGEGHAFLNAWARMLECAADVASASLVSIRDEMEAYDLEQAPADAAGAWCVAMRLAAARFDSDLSVWFSMHRALLLEERSRPLARLAIGALGERVSAAHRFIPEGLAAAYLLQGREEARAVGIDLSAPLGLSEVGQVEIDLLGGFRVVRNGHVVTDDVWRRKKSGVLAARLVLGLGSFVARQTILDELWPQCEYARARQNLYTATSRLRTAFRQAEDGPQYVMAQGSGLALNDEYVFSDTVLFDRLAREVLVRKQGASTREALEACLKLEEIYSGPLYMPEEGNLSFFLQMRRVFESKFADCMVRGIRAALAEEDIAAASWLADAATRQVPSREDVMRLAMQVYGQCGRRREAVELYEGLRYFLRKEQRGEPEAETKVVYEDVVGTGRVYL